MQNKYKHIIWDWNGTLVDDVWLAVEVMNNLLKKRDLPLLTFESYREIFDFPVKDYYERVGFDFEKDSFEIVGTEFIRAYDERHLENKLHKNCLSVLKTLNDRGITQSILSARKHEQLEKEIVHYGLLPYIPYLVGLDNHYGGSKIENGKLLLKELKLNPQEVVMIGDTVHDYQVACEIESDCLLISAGHNSVEKLKRCNVPIVSTISDVLSFF